MSFSSNTKSELCRVSCNTLAEKMAELYGFLLFGKSFSHRAVSFSTENGDAAKHFCNMMTEITGCITEIVTTSTNKKSGNELYTVRIPYEQDREKILAFFGHSDKEINLRINKAITDTQETSSAFLRGIFLCCGSIADPNSEYHLEFSVPFMNLAKDLCSIISFAGEGRTEKILKPRTVMRKGSYVVYLKDKDMIAELLAMIGAYSANMSFVQTIIEKDIINRTNRKINSELANLNKTAKAAAVQLDAISTILYNKRTDLLSQDLLELAMLRWENPEMSLRELSNNLSKPISRSGINHRFERIIEIANECKKTIK